MKILSLVLCGLLFSCNAAWADTDPSQPAPSQPVPNQPAPNQPAPSQPVPNQPTPGQPAPGRSAPPTPDQTPPAPPGNATIYLVNFSQGHAQFVLSTHGPRVRIFGPRPKDEKVICDVASSNIFGQGTLFRESWCRIHIDITHDNLWLWAETSYPSTSCSQFGCWRGKEVYFTQRVHLEGLAEGRIYEYDACGAIGVNGANCGWREITKQDQSY